MPAANIAGYQFFVYLRKVIVVAMRNHIIDL